MGDLLLVGVGPLTGGQHHYPALLVNVGQARFGLQIGVLLHRDAVLALDDHLRCGETGLHIPLADLVVDADIRRPNLRVDECRPRLHGRFGVGDERQVLINDLNQVPCLGRDGLRLGHDHRHLVAHKTDNISSILGGRVGVIFAVSRPRSTQHRLVVPLQAVLVDRHVFGRKHAEYAHQCLGL